VVGVQLQHLRAVRDVKFRELEILLHVTHRHRQVEAEAAVEAAVVVVIRHLHGSLLEHQEECLVVDPDVLLVVDVLHQ
jgi:hypothetical protein